MDNEKTLDQIDVDHNDGSEIPNDTGGIDETDMYRMGKQQKFRVCERHFIRPICLTVVAYLSCHGDYGIYIARSKYLGGCPNCSVRWPSKWRSCWNVLELYLDIHGVHVHCHVFGRDGQHGTYVWGTVPLVTIHRLSACIISLTCIG